jgi:hypothetical protein
VADTPCTATYTYAGDANHNGSSDSTTITITRAPTTLTLDNLSQTYDSTPKSATVTTSPAGLAVTVTYSGTTTAPTNADSYPVVATITAPNYSGSASGTLVIAKASSTTTLSGGGTYVYNGSARAATVSVTGVGGLNLNPAPDYSGNCSAAPVTVTDTPCTASYTYPGDTNHNSSSGSTSITITAASATINIGNLSQIYDGNPKPVTYTTSPAGLTITVTYSGTTTAPTNPGSYPVMATIANPNYAGSSSGTLIITAIHSISLVPGWNLISFNLHPQNTAISSVLSSIAGQYTLIFAWDSTGAHAGSGNWMKYDPNGPSYQNTLSNLDETMGFWINMTSASTLVITGDLPGTSNITLRSSAGGWNLVSYPSAVNRPMPNALRDYGVGSNFSLVYAYHANDVTDLWKLYDPNALPFANNLTALSPGWGYWIRVPSTSTWSVEYTAP